MSIVANSGGAFAHIAFTTNFGIACLRFLVDSRTLRQSNRTPL
jgi:hypothetical protein